MARNKTVAGQKNSSGEVSIDPAFGTALFNAIQVPRLRTLFQKIYPDRDVQAIGANRIRMRCPAPGHTDRTASFFVDTLTGFAGCEACHYHTRNLLEMLRDTLGMSYSEGVTAILEHGDYRAVSGQLSKKLEALDFQQQAIKYMQEACNQYLQKLVNFEYHAHPIEGTDANYYSPAARSVVRPTLDWLFKQRELDPDVVAYLPYGVTPPGIVFKALVRDLVTQDYEKAYRTNTNVGAYSRVRREKTVEVAGEFIEKIPVEFVHSVAFFTGFTANTPGNLRLRRYSPDNVKEGFFWDTMALTKTQLGFFGLYSPTLVSHVSRRELARTKTLVVEGEFDALKILQHVVKNCVPDLQIIASSGSNNDIETLKETGRESVLVLGDHPDPRYGRGDDWLKYILSNAFHIRPQVYANWDELRGPDITIKDPDDVITRLGWDHFKRLVLDAPSSFVTADIWAAEKAIEAGLAIDESDMVLRMQKAAEYGQCVRLPMVLSAFILKVSQALNVPGAPLRQAIVKAKDSEAGFIARVVETLRYEFLPLFKRESNKGGTIVLFHRQKRRMLEIPVGDGNAILTCLSNIFGNMYEFFRDTIGIPQFDSNTPENVPVMRDGQKFIADYLKIAMQEIYQDVLSESECTPLGPGVHFEWNPADIHHTGRIHNGTKWFRMDCNEETDTIEAVELPGPIDASFMFMLGNRHGTWSKEMMTVEDVNSANNITIDQMRQAFEDIKNIYQTFWSFKHQEEDSMFLAAFQFVIAAGDAFVMKNIVRLMGQSESGKSTCLATFAGGQSPMLRLNSQVGYSSDFSPAGLIQDWAFSTLAMGLDEFSQTDNAHSTKSKHIENIQNDIFRQIGYEGGAVKHRAGSKDHPTRIRTHVVLTTVHEPRDAQDENRSYTITTVKSDTVKDPQVGILKTFSTERMAELRKIIQLGILRFLPKLRRAQDEIYTILNKEQLTSYVANSRFLRNFATIGSVLKVLGYDWRAMVAQMAESRKERLMIQKQNTQVTLMFERLLRTAVVPLPGGSAKTSIQSLFIESDGHTLLNSSGVGASLYKERGVLVVDLLAATAPQGVLGRVEDLGKMTPAQFRAIYEQHPKFIPPSRYPELGMTAFMSRVGINASASSLVVCFDIDDIRKGMISLKSQSDGAESNVISIVKTSANDMT